MDPSEVSMPTDSTSASSVVRRLHVLVTIARCGSLTAASAEALNASQASVSQWLAEIESAFGARLFERGRQLTAAGFVGLPNREVQARMLLQAR